MQKSQKKSQGSISPEDFRSLDLPELLGMLEARRLLGSRVLGTVKDLFYRADHKGVKEWEWPTVDSLLIALRHSGEKDEEKRRGLWTRVLCNKLAKGPEESTHDARDALGDFVEAFDELKQRLDAE